MEKYNLKIDNENNRISWLYSGKEYSIEIDGLKIATVQDEKNIFVKTRNKNNEVEIQYYKMNGEFLFSFVKKSGLVSWMNGSKKINLSIDKLQDARLYKDCDVVVILKGEYHSQSQLDIYSVSGDLLHEKS